MPTQDHEPDQILFVGGDFNLHLNPNLDKIDSMSNKNNNIVYRKEVIPFMNLTDCFRNLYPNL